MFDKVGPTLTGFLQLSNLQGDMLYPFGGIASVYLPIITFY